MKASLASPRPAGWVATNWASAITSPSVDSPRGVAVRVRSPWVCPTSWQASGAAAGAAVGRGGRPVEAAWVGAQRGDGRAWLLPRRPRRVGGARFVRDGEAGPPRGGQSGGRAREPLADEAALELLPASGLELL